ncbi:MAG: carbamoyltransferase [Candidatus Delongbacteria bacterium]|nr:carbamoyltransferase [Candidatus Delongbacteria bacterium]
MPEIILGISAYYHDSSAALIIDGEIISAVHEERFTRKKHDQSFPRKSIEHIFSYTGIKIDDITAVVFYEKPYLKFERLLETYHEFFPKGLKSFSSSIPVWIKEKLFMTGTIKKELKKFGNIDNIRFLYSEHHLSHAASAFYPSPFEDAAILTIDGVGERATSIIAQGKGNSIKILKELHFPHSVGLLYSAFTYYCGFRVNSGEYKLMGLAPYGDPDSERTRNYINIIKEKLVDIKEDGSIVLNMEYFNYATGLKMIHDKKWKELFGLETKDPESEITQEYMDISLAIQTVTEDIFLKMAKHAKEITGSKNIVLAGGVALNSVANGKLLKEGVFENIWVQPASGDAGGALGAALAYFYTENDVKRKIILPDSMQGAYLGPEYTNDQIENVLKKYRVTSKYFDNSKELAKISAQYLDEGSVVGWFQGRMEFGPRALGNRSILGDARKAEMQKRMNLKIKYREGFRPFAPSVLEEDIQEYFEIDIPSPYMLNVVPVVEKRRSVLPENYYQKPLYERLYFERSDIPAVTHIDYSARLQSVNKDVNFRYWELINEFKNLTGYGVIINTSFNVRGEPIVESPEDALSCFMRTEMDYLVLGDHLVSKADIDPELQKKFKKEFKPD